MIEQDEQSNMIIAVVIAPHDKKNLIRNHLACKPTRQLCSGLLVNIILNVVCVRKIVAYIS